jgi:hypothetical protein
LYSRAASWNAAACWRMNGRLCAVSPPRHRHGREGGNGSGEVAAGAEPHAREPQATALGANGAQGGGAPRA